MPIRRPTLFKRLTWRVALLSFREWLVIAVATLALIGYGFFMAGRGGEGAGEQLRLQTDLDQSNRDINELSLGDKAGRCKVFRRRQDLLAKATDLMGRCGSGRSAGGSFNYISGLAAETRLYDSLVQEACGNSKP